MQLFNSLSPFNFYINADHCADLINYYITRTLHALKASLNIPNFTKHSKLYLKYCFWKLFMGMIKSSTIECINVDYSYEFTSSKLWWEFRKSKLITTTSLPLHKLIMQCSYFVSHRWLHRRLHNHCVSTTTNCYQHSITTFK